MRSKTIFDSGNSDGTVPNLRTTMLRVIHAAQPIPRASLAKRLNLSPAELTKELKPLIASKIVGEKDKTISFNGDGTYFIGVNFGVRSTQVGIATLGGDGISEEDSFETPRDPKAAVAIVKERVEELVGKNTDRELIAIGVSVPGMTDADRTRLVYAPNLNWRNLDFAKEFGGISNAKVIVENDAAAAALFEARRKLASNDVVEDFILVRSGTGIGVGLVINGEVFRGSGAGRGIAGEFGHMTIVAGGKQCVCGNRGCWEKYASAAAGATLYLGDRPPARGEMVPRFVEIVSKAENGDNRSRRTLEKIGDYLGMGIANVVMGTGIPKAVLSGRIVHGWKFIKDPMNDAIKRSIVGKIEGWSVAAGSPIGFGLGGALEVAADDYLHSL
jgi:predicted NBD/HSP70 family sugar kinase